MAMIFVTCFRKNALRAHNSHCNKVSRTELGQGGVGDDCSVVKPVIGGRNVLVGKHDIELNIYGQI